jgi:type IV secretion system protein TrbI
MKRRFFLLSPKVFSDTLDKPNVRRVNNVPLYLLALVVGLFLLVMVMVAIKRTQAPTIDATKDAMLTSNHAHALANVIVGEETSGLVPAATLAPAIVKEVQPTSTQTVNTVPTSLVSETVSANLPTLLPVQTEYAQQIAQLKWQRFEQAIKAPTSVAFVPNHTTYKAANFANNRDVARAQLAAIRQQMDVIRSDDPTAAYQERLAQIRSSIGGYNAGEMSNHLLSSATTNSQQDYAQFDHAAGSDRWQLDTDMQAPLSPYTLRAGFVVPALLLSGINSELPGQILAQVAENVYDTPTGKYLLIPQGARLLGRYANEVAYGQERVLIAWQRIVFPDGKALDIGAMQGADSAGYAGFHDQVNNHYVRLFSSAFLMSAITAGIAMSQNSTAYNSNGTPTLSSAMSESLGQQLGQVTAQLIAKNMNIAPTLEIRPGYRFNVMVTQDLVFTKPYRDFDTAMARD